MKYLFLISFVIICGCQGFVTDNSNNSSTSETTEQQINSLVQSENSYRETLGETELSPGLSCTVQQVSGGMWLSSSSPGYQSSQGVLTVTGTSYSYLYQGNFNESNTSSGQSTLIPTAISPLFVNVNYRIICSGNIVITATDYYEFNMNSDDGSILTIDGTQVINDDGTHAMLDKQGTKLLRSGVHTFNLQYAQSGNGAFGLVLLMNNNSINPELYYH